jgi:TolB-like protein
LVLAPGSRLSHYRLVEQIGRGGMGVVWKARDTRLDRDVAIKLLTEALAGDTVNLARFEREARALAALNHPCIVTIYSVEQEADVRFLTMELIGGETLSQRCEGGPLSTADLLGLAIPIVDALRAAHAQGITHRDLKPANIMITADGHVKVLDFGLAKLQREPLTAKTSEDLVESTGITREGDLLGTVNYMSPEQVDGRPIDARSDLFSFGVILHEMATGRRPFRGGGLASIMSAILRDDPPSVTELREDLPGDLGRIVQRCLEKDPDRRYPSAVELLEDLERLRDTVKGAGERRRRPARIVAAGVVLPLLLVALGAWLFGDRGGGEVAGGTGVNGILPSVAVLPCRSSGAGEAYFGEGITVDIITELSKIRALRVISPRSALRYGDDSKTSHEIAGELSVAHLLRCSYRQVDDSVRITAQLIAAETEAVAWAESYDRKLEDVLTIWSEVALKIADSLDATLTSGERASIRDTRTVHPEAYRAYQQGRALWRTRTEEGLERAIDAFQRAIAYDSEYAEAWAGLADAYEVLPLATLQRTKYRDWQPVREELLGKARRAAKRALEIDPNLAQAHATLGHQLRYWDWEEAERELRRAIELQPGYPWAHSWFGEMLSRHRRHDEAIAELELSVALDPVTPVVRAELAEALAYARRFDEAIASMRDVVAANPSWVTGYFGLGDIYLWAGRYDDAAAAFGQGLEMSGVDPGPIGVVMKALTGEVAGAEAVAVMGYVEEWHGPQTAAELLAGLGEVDLAFEALQRAWETRDHHHPLRIQSEPLLDALRDDPRYDAMVERLGFSRD